MWVEQIVVADALRRSEGYVGAARLPRDVLQTSFVQVHILGVSWGMDDFSRLCYRDQKHVVMHCIIVSTSRT